MKKAPLHQREKERLQKLVEYEVLDTEGEQAFDDLTELASEICGTPISLISLIDTDRQWFKSKVGLEAQETNRDIAFCSHAILEDDIFEIKDATQDDRFSDNPLVTGNPDIKFYAGMPLVSPEGLPIGTLCVIDNLPRALNDHQKKALRILSREIIKQLELRVKSKKLELANEFKTNFLSNMSHEIRTPLNAIIGFSELLLKNSQEYLADEIAESYIKNIDFSGKHLFAMINSVLDLGKIEAGKMELETSQFDINSTLSNVVEMLKVKAQQSGVKIIYLSDTDTSFIVNLDIDKISQIVINIVNNAIKFSNMNGSVAINLTIKNKTIHLQVIDSGIGISEEELPLIFDKYHQAGQKKTLGTGLGLSITLGLIELMNGDISVTSEVGEGTTVNIELPTNCESVDHDEINENIDLIEPDKKIELKVADIRKGAKVLLVEDNKINQVVAKAMLETHFCDVTVVENGKDAIKAAENKHFDLILMDINLPDISGFETTFRIKQHDPEVVIAALTADIFAKSEHSGLFHTKLTKPITLIELEELLVDVLS